MATDREIAEFFGPRDFRTKADYEKRRPKKNPEISLPKKVKPIWGKKRRSHLGSLVQCVVPGCSALLGATNVRHYTKIHDLSEPPRIDRDATLAQALTNTAPHRLEPST